jgi:hypothetical protein
MPWQRSRDTQLAAARRACGGAEQASEQRPRENREMFKKRVWRNAAIEAPDARMRAARASQTVVYKLYMCFPAAAPPPAARAARLTLAPQMHRSGARASLRALALLPSAALPPSHAAHPPPARAVVPAWTRARVTRPQCRRRARAPTSGAGTPGATCSP